MLAGFVFEMAIIEINFQIFGKEQKCEIMEIQTKQAERDNAE